MTLEQWKRQWDLTSREAADVLGIGRQTVNDLSAMVRSPTLLVAYQVHQRTKQKDPRTAVRLWEMLTPDERREVFGDRGRP